MNLLSFGSLKAHSWWRFPWKFCTFDYDLAQLSWDCSWHNIPFFRCKLWNTKWLSSVVLSATAPQLLKFSSPFSCLVHPHFFKAAQSSSFKEILVSLTLHTHQQVLRSFSFFYPTLLRLLQEPTNPRSSSQTRKSNLHKFIRKAPPFQTYFSFAFQWTPSKKLSAPLKPSCLPASFRNWWSILRLSRKTLSCLWANVAYQYRSTVGSLSIGTKSVSAFLGGHYHRDGKTIDRIFMDLSVNRREEIGW